MSWIFRHGVLTKSMYFCSIGWNTVEAISNHLYLGLNRSINIVKVDSLCECFVFYWLYLYFFDKASCIPSAIKIPPVVLSNQDLTL